PEPLDERDARIGDLARLEPADIPLIHSGEVGQSLLGQLAVPPEAAYAVPDALVHHPDRRTDCHSARVPTSPRGPPSRRMTKRQLSCLLECIRSLADRLCAACYSGPAFRPGARG